GRGGSRGGARRDRDRVLVRESVEGEEDRASLRGRPRGDRKTFLPEIRDDVRKHELAPGGERLVNGARAAPERGRVPDRHRRLGRPTVRQGELRREMRLRRGDVETDRE